MYYLIKMCVRFLAIYTWIYFIKGVCADEKTWICNTNADNKANWVSGDYLHNCTGFYFPEEFQEICLTSLRKVTTNTIYLPITGDVELRDQADITLSEDSNTCVMVRDDIKQNIYMDPQCWKNENQAIPDAERAPCTHDNVIFPEDATYSVIQSTYPLYDQSITIRGEKLSTHEWLYETRDLDGCSEFNNQMLGYQFVCHSVQLYDFICNLRDFWRKVVCSDPVYVYGHCSLFCGSVIFVEANRNFDIQHFFETLTKDQTADAHYVFLLLKNVYQITMTDKGEFTGDSIYHAKKFYESIKNDLDGWDINSIRANFSGFPIAYEKTVRNAFTIIFSTFFLVVLVFGIMFLLHTGPLENTTIIPSSFRIPFGSGVRRSTKPFVFARFDNKDDGATSIGGSIVSLDKSFDNPMYGQQMASTSSGSLQTVEEAEELKEVPPKNVLESEFSNPLYEEDKIMFEVVED